MATLRAASYIDRCIQLGLEEPWSADPSPRRRSSTSVELTKQGLQEISNLLKVPRPSLHHDQADDMELTLSNLDKKIADWKQQILRPTTRDEKSRPHQCREQASQGRLHVKQSQSKKTKNRG